MSKISFVLNVTLSPSILSLLPIRPRAGDPLGCDLADEKTVTRTPHIFLPCRGILYGLERMKVNEKTERRRETELILVNPKMKVCVVTYYTK